MTSIKKLMDLRGRRALITGGAGWIGSTMADTLAEMGADLVLLDRPDSDLGTKVDLIRKKWNVKIDGLTCDLEDFDARTKLLTELKENYSNIDILINNAAFGGMTSLEGWVVPFEEQCISTWRRAIEVNLTAAFHLSQGLTPLLRKSKGGTIINIASIYGELGPDWRLYDETQMGNPAAYSVSKGGLIQLTRWMATTLAPDIRVNSLSPGGVWRDQPVTFVKNYCNRTPLGRMATEDDFRGAIGFLASDMSRYVTGEVLHVDGGWAAW